MENKLISQFNKCTVTPYPTKLLRIHFTHKVCRDFYTLTLIQNNINFIINSKEVRNVQSTHKPTVVQKRKKKFALLGVMKRYLLLQPNSGTALYYFRNSTLTLMDVTAIELKR